MAIRLKCLVVLGSAAAMPLIGCSRTEHTIADAYPPEPREIYQPTPQVSGLPEQLLDRPPYRLNVGDVLEIIYQVKNVVSDTPYELKIEDVVKLQFPYQEKFNQERTVQADGFIRCLLLGQVRAAGRTPAELEEQLRHGYARYIRDPELTVVVEAANVKIVELKKAITTAPRGQSRLVPIKPDGTIDLPYIGEAKVAGLTVQAAKQLLDARYAEEDLKEIEVTVQTLEFAPRQFSVMGEVWAPGAIETTRPMTLTQALVRQGGPNPRADRQRIVLIRRQHVPVPQALVFDLNALLTARQATELGWAPKGSIWRYDPYLHDGDIVYVPPTGLAMANDWIDQVFTKGVRAVVPYSGVVGMNFGYEIRQAPTTITTKTLGPPRFNTQIGP